MKKLMIIFTLLVLLGINKVASQNILSPELERISNLLTDYFKSERENIHVHLNKQIYLTSERIWFKGYIINQQTKLPFLQTNNVYTVLYDQNGIKVKSNLHFASNGFFEGYINLDKSIVTGKYFIKVYTNYMNNYIEDESSVFEIEIKILYPKILLIKKTLI